MATAFPAALDSFVNPTASSNMSDAPVLHHVQHANLNDAVRAMQVYIGTTGSVSVADLTGKIATGGGASVQTGALAASTTQAPNASAVQAELANKTNFGHLHGIAGVTGLQTLLDSLQAQISALSVGGGAVTADALTLDGTNVMTLDGVLELTL